MKMVDVSKSAKEINIEMLKQIDVISIEIMNALQGMKLVREVGVVLNNANQLSFEIKIPADATHQRSHPQDNKEVDDVDMVTN